MRESGSEQRSRCGTACTASVRVRRRAHFCRVRVSDCGDRACLRHVFACACGAVHTFVAFAWQLLGSDVFEACFACACCAVHIFVAFAWQTAGIGRVAGMSQVCRGAVPWELVSGRVVHTHGERAFRVAGRGSCVLGACWKRASGPCWRAVPWSWVRGVSRARMILRAVTCVSRGRCGT